jgi:hypothetical protein
VRWDVDRTSTCIALGWPDVRTGPQFHHRLGDGHGPVQQIDARPSEPDQLAPPEPRPRTEEDEDAVAVLDRIRDGPYFRDRGRDTFGWPLRSCSGQKARVARDQLVLDCRRKHRLEQAVGPW